MTDEGVALAGTTLLCGDDTLADDAVLVEDPVGIRAFDIRSLPSTPERA